jgi:hypothetical protein
VLFSVPTADFRTGDFNRKLGAQILDRTGSPIMVPTTEGGLVPLQQGMIFDPFSGNRDGTGRAVFSSGGRVNAIPASRLNAPMMKMLALVPVPNQPGDNSNYFNTGMQRLDRNNFDAKINWNRNERTACGGYSAMKRSFTVNLDLARGRMQLRRRRRQGPHARADRGNGHDLHRLADVPD